MSIHSPAIAMAVSTLIFFLFLMVIFRYYRMRRIAAQQRIAAMNAGNYVGTLGYAHGTENQQYNGGYGGGMAPSQGIRPYHMSPPAQGGGVVTGYPTGSAGQPPSAYPTRPYHVNYDNNQPQMAAPYPPGPNALSPHQPNWGGGYNSIPHGQDHDHSHQPRPAFPNSTASAPAYDSDPCYLAPQGNADWGANAPSTSVTALPSSNDNTTPTPPKY